MHRPALIIFSAAALLIAGGAHADVVIDRAGWQLALRMNEKKRVYHDIEAWLFPPSQAVKLRPRAMVTLINRDLRAETAILLRYSFAARLRKIGKKNEGIWTVPFLVEERRIPRIAGITSHEVPLYLNRVALRAYLKRMYRAGFWPDAFRVQVMVEPRPGETFENRIAEKVLPIIWKTSSAPGR